jgi:hypothetical protein
VVLAAIKKVFRPAAVATTTATTPVDFFEFQRQQALAKGVVFVQPTPNHCLTTASIENSTLATLEVIEPNVAAHSVSIHRCAGGGGGAMSSLSSPLLSWSRASGSGGSVESSDVTSLKLRVHCGGSGGGRRLLDCCCVGSARVVACQVAAHRRCGSV